MRNPEKAVILVESDQAARCAAAVALAARVDLPLVEAADAPPEALHLVVTDDRLELRDGREPSVKGVHALFAARSLRPGRGGLSRRQPLARAMGAGARTVLDATAGLGLDAARLAAFGLHVTAVERCAVAAALLEDGLRRAREDPELAGLLGNRLTIRCGESKDLLERLEPKPDVVYLDPMFPARRKSSALARKHVRLLRRLVGDDPDAAELLAVARRHARQRVVVKRADDAEPLAPDPAMTYAGKLVRYDVYPAPRSA